MPKRKPKAAEPGRVNFQEEPAEIERWWSAARAEGLSLSAWIRRVCRMEVSRLEAQSEKGR